ncbi:hypothetical protein GCM10011352_24400 [Marinobacterium zhoushanense]|uniref:Sulfotransferase family protein n=1 Tax=Marinobacterium zhoushanense TaxID=1679163 RepID=A0ABQ1KKG4_9GAMM|nr:hypothetical protein [Marinobacterium zhoushanense]GGB97401.1 hypothetical protein GCM10011352_24400 [Marinobacterium zhoushanense]
MAKHGILYPDTPFSRSAHHILQILFQDDSQILPKYVKKAGGYQKIRALSKKYWESVREEVRTTNPELVLISSETFYQLDEAALSKMKTYLAGVFDEVEFVFYVREPAAKYLSLLQQSIKTRCEFFPPDKMRELGHLATIERVFGTAVRVIAFDRSSLINGDVVYDLSARLLSPNIEPGQVETIMKNESISPEAISILNKYQRFMFNRGESLPKHKIKRIREGIIRYEKENGRNRKPGLKPGIATSIQASSEELLSLRNRYGIEFPGIDYDRVGTGSIDPSQYQQVSDVIEVDTELEAEIMLYLIDTEMLTLKTVRDKALGLFKK